MKYVGNFKRFIQAVEMHSKFGNNKGLTIGEMFEAFEEVACFGLKTICFTSGRKIAVNYNLTLSCFNFVSRRDL